MRHVDQGNRVSEHDIAVDMERAHVVVALVMRGCTVYVEPCPPHRGGLGQADHSRPDGRCEDAAGPFRRCTLSTCGWASLIEFPLWSGLIRVLGNFDLDPVVASDSLIYLCYNGRDSLEDGQRVTRFLNKNGYTTWKASEELLPGMLDDAQVERGLGRSRAVVALITPELVKDKDFLMEISFAKSIGTRILPILVQETPRLPHLLTNLE